MWDKLLTALGLKSPQVTSSSIAKERLQIVLIGDRTQVSLDVINKMKADIIEAIRKHVEIDESSLDVQITTDEKRRSSALVANIPLRAVHRSASQ